MDTTARAKDHLGKFYDQCSRRARVAAYVLLAGLFLEVVNGIIWFHGIEGLASMISVAMMFGGVSGEIFFEYRARSADKGTTMPLLQSSAGRAVVSAGEVPHTSFGVHEPRRRTAATGPGLR